MKEKDKNKDLLGKFIPLQVPMFNLCNTDPLGSYTGVPLLPTDIPVQDADDL